MKYLSASLLLCMLALIAGSCSTRAIIFAPRDADVYLNGKQVYVGSRRVVRLRPFGWSGATYKLMRKGQVLSKGKLETSFRVASCFWPPFAIFYWPHKFTYYGYDLAAGGKGLSRGAARTRLRAERMKERAARLRRRAARRGSSPGTTSSSGGFRDTVVLKSGLIINNVVVAVTSRAIVVTYPNGRTVTIRKSKVQSVKKGR